jgi:hypothetical protein
LGELNNKNIDDVGEKIQKTTKELMKKGVPARTAAYASAMGYMRALRKK